MTKEIEQEIEALAAEEQQAPEIQQESEKQELEQKAEAEEEGKPEKPPKGFVPQQALHEEREKRKEFQRRIAQIEQESAQRTQLLEQRFAQMQEAWAKQNAPKPPEYDVDPLGNVKHTLDATQAELTKLREKQEQEYRRQQEEYQRAQYVNHVASAVSQAEAEYAQENPDYLEAVNHLKGLRARQLEALGWDRASILNYVQNEAFQIAEAALQRGQSPAEVAFNMAVASGWAKKEQQNSQEQKIETLQKGTQAAKSLGSGGNPSGKLTVDAIANMDAQEFDEFVRNGGWEKLIG